MHDHPTHAMAINVLKHMANQRKKPLSRIKRLFVVKQNAAITKQFWESLYQLYPEQHYHEIYHCPDCQKFTLE